MYRGDGINRRYGVDVYIVLRYKGRYYDYCSIQGSFFPALFAEIVGILKLQRLLVTYIRIGKNISFANKEDTG